MRRLLAWLAGGGALGDRGERCAARWLRRRGYRILERKYSLGRDEADLIALDPDGRTVVIVEVKTRSTDEPGPETGIDHKKRYRLGRLAERLGRQPRFAGRPLRFDAVAIVWPKEGRPQVRHYVDAFESPF